MRSNWKRWLTLTLLCFTIQHSVAQSGDWSRPRTSSTRGQSSWSRPGARGAQSRSWTRPAPQPRSVPSYPQSNPIVTLHNPVPVRTTVRGDQPRPQTIVRGQNQELPSPTPIPVPRAPEVEAPTVTLGPPPGRSPRMPDAAGNFPVPQQVPGLGPIPALVSSAPAHCDCGINWGDSGSAHWSSELGDGLFGCGMDCPMWSGMENRWYVGAEYLAWDIKPDATPALVTTGVSNVNNLVPGALSGTSTMVLFGGDVETDTQSGARFRAGIWFNPEHTLGLEASYFFLNQENVSSTFATGGTPLLAVPFFNPNTGLEDRVLLASPGVSSGSAQVDFDTEMWGTDVNFRTNFMMGPNSFIDFLAGFRSAGLEESLNLFTNSTVTATNALTQTWDRFSTRNQFYGGQIGAHAEFRRGRWALELTGKLGIGNTYQSVSTLGNTITNDGMGNVTNTVGGIFTQQSNIVHLSRNDFTLMPEVGLKVGFQLREGIRATVGYNFLYWSSVVRPGDHIDRNVNFNQATTGPQQPTIQFNDSDFWAQGLSTGLELRW